MKYLKTEKMFSVLRYEIFVFDECDSFLEPKTFSIWLASKVKDAVQYRCSDAAERKGSRR